MAAQSFKEWFDIITDVGELDPFYGFTSKGVAHIAWDAAIKSLEGVQNQTHNSAMVQCRSHMYPGPCQLDDLMLCRELPCRIERAAQHQ